MIIFSGEYIASTFRDIKTSELPIQTFLYYVTFL